MSKIFTIFSFEFRSTVSKKSWIVTTIIMCLIAATLVAVPRIIGFFSSSKEDEALSDSEYTVQEPYAVFLETQDITKDQLEKAQLGKPVYVDSVKALEDMVQSDQVEKGFHVLGSNKYTIYLKDTSAFSTDASVDPFGTFMKNLQMEKYLKEKEVSYEEYLQVIESPVEREKVMLGVDASNNYWSTYILMFIVYFLVLTYGAGVATSVAREKTNRTMELLITSTKPRFLLFGKVFGVGLAGLLQFSLMSISAFVSYQVNKSYFPFDISQFLGITPKLLVIFFVYILLGYAMYMCLYAMLGSTVSKVEEVNGAVTPLTFMMILTFLAVNLQMAGSANSFLMKILSFIPFSSPMAMYARVSLSSIPLWEVILSMVILFGSTILFGIVAAKIYRLGTLNYGKRLKFFQSIKMLFQKQ